jgi:mRNA-degrading endonuclease toxin of MazEF toxin-antitoxin module
MDLRDALQKAGASAFSMSPGDVCLVEDESVVIPETPDERREYHPHGRPCVILQNGMLCTRVTYPIVLIAPTTHRTDLKESSDFQVEPSAVNGLHQPCLVMLGHIQPVLKPDVFKKIGTLSHSEWDLLSRHLMWVFDLE